MRFWDSSALVPLLALEPTTASMQALFDEDSELAVWWSTEVECVSAIARRERADPGWTGTAALARLDGLRRLWTELAPTSRLRAEARRIVRVHDLRAAHGFQLAAAISAAEGRPDSLAVVTLDDRLALAAGREGFQVLPA